MCWQDPWLSSYSCFLQWYRRFFYMHVFARVYRRRTRLQRWVALSLISCRVQCPILVPYSRLSASDGSQSSVHSFTASTLFNKTKLHHIWQKKTKKTNQTKQNNMFTRKESLKTSIPNATVIGFRIKVFDVSSRHERDHYAWSAIEKHPKNTAMNNAVKFTITWLTFSLSHNNLI
jgi:hypothetical protein